MMWLPETAYSETWLCRPTRGSDRVIDRQALERELSVRLNPITTILAYICILYRLHVASRMLKICKFLCLSRF